MRATEFVVYSLKRTIAEREDDGRPKGGAPGRKGRERTIAEPKEPKTSSDDTRNEGRGNGRKARPPTPNRRGSSTLYMPTAKTQEYISIYIYLFIIFIYLFIYFLFIPPFL